MNTSGEIDREAVYQIDGRELWIFLNGIAQQRMEEGMRDLSRKQFLKEMGISAAKLYRLALHDADYRPAYMVGAEYRYTREQINKIRQRKDENF